jgi:hypothetical protein
MKVDLSGERFGALTVIGRSSVRYESSGRSWPTWLCECDCGNDCHIRTSSLRAGNQVSCGCIKNARASLLGKSRAEKLSRDSCYCGKPIEVRFSGSRNGLCRKCWNDRRRKYGKRSTAALSDWILLNYFRVNVRRGSLPPVTTEIRRKLLAVSRLSILIKRKLQEHGNHQ